MGAHLLNEVQSIIDMFGLRCSKKKKLKKLYSILLRFNLVPNEKGLQT